MMEEIRRIFAGDLDQCFDRWTSYFNQRFEDTEMKNKNNQRLAGLQHKAQQPHLATDCSPAKSLQR